ncbi:MAG TPA: tetratricopeptide repeat protein [Enhygromyxa sp.]|nr:tetratricopeptide repeat protein [Enhygromyxa sp.]
MLSFRRSVLARSFGPLTLGLLLAATGCAKKGDGTTAPLGKGKSKAELEAEKEKAKATAVVNQLIVQANESLAAGRYMTAREIAEEALSRNPDNADAYVVLGAAAWRAGNFAESTESLRKAMELDPKNFGGAVALARNLRAASQYEESLAVLEPVIAAEADGFQGKSCEELEDCEDVGGWCDTAAKQCKPPVAVETRAAQLWAYYVTLDADKGAAVADEVFLSGAAAADLTNDAIRGYADYLRAFAGKGELVEIEGETGSSDLALDVYTGLVHSSAKIGKQERRVLFSPLQIESRIDSELAAELKLEPLGKTNLLNMGEFEVTLIPVIEFEGMKLENVPALISDLEIFAAGLPEKPGVILGHQALHKLGSLVADMPGQSLTLTKAPPSAPAGAVERPLLMLDQWSIHVPATPVSIDGSTHEFWTWLGYSNPSAITLTAKAYLKSGHLPREIEDPEDVDYGRKMVYVDDVAFGELKIPGVGGIVHLDQPGEPNLTTVTAFAGFELGGSINVALLEKLRVTWALSQGKIWVEKG